MIFDSDFSHHINHVVSKASNLVGFIKRTTSDFTDISAIIYLYKTINILINKIESVQHRYLRYLTFKGNRAMSRLEHDYTDIATHFDLQTIKSLHHYHDCLLSFKIINNLIDCNEINNLFLERQLTYNLRSHRILQEETSNSNYGFHSTVNHIKRSYNILPTIGVQTLFELFC